MNFTEAAGGTSGTLTVTDSGHTANTTLLGQFMASDFHIVSDGLGRTLVTDPQPPAMSVANAAALANPHPA